MGRFRNHRIVVCCLMLTAIVFLVLTDHPIVQWFRGHDFFSVSAHTDRSSASDKSEPTNNSEMTKRLEIKEKACHELSNDVGLNAMKHNGRFVQGRKPSFIFLEEYNFSACIVGKIGSTFLKQVFMILKEGKEFTSKLETLPRLLTHEKSNALNTKPESTEWRQARVLNVARDPYTRLFSAYIDRVTLPSITHAIRNGSKCKYDVTFNEFLEIVLRDTINGVLDTHWSPIYLLCLPCDVTSTFIAKQESFTSDMKYVMDNLNLSAETRHSMDNKLSSSRNKWTITGIVKAIMGTQNPRFLNEGCVGWLGIIKNVWKAFQIQGYIDENVELPMTFYNRPEDFSNVDIFLKTIFTTIEEHPLTSEEGLLQRNRALIKAYSQVDSEKIEQIKRLHRPDFELFGYSNEPPGHDS